MCNHPTGRPRVQNIFVSKCFRPKFFRPSGNFSSVRPKIKSKGGGWGRGGVRGEARKSEPRGIKSHILTFCKALAPRGAARAPTWRGYPVTSFLVPKLARTWDSKMQSSGQLKSNMGSPSFEVVFGSDFCSTGYPVTPRFILNFDSISLA